ncbi:cubilin [Trichonephila clavipes]|nr:cubilin [Trichonephila clavipes]
MATGSYLNPIYSRSQKHYVILNGTEGEIASPGFPNTYHDTGEHHWTVYVPSGMMISVRFLSISITTLADHYQGPFRVAIFDGMHNTDPSLGEFSGFQIPDPVVSTGNVIHIIFYSYQFDLGSFHLKWIAVTESGIVVDMPTPTDGYEPCWEEIQLNSTESMTVNSPDYPRNYPNNIKCTYIMRAPPHQHVELNITELELEWHSEACSFDRVEIFYCRCTNVGFVNSSMSAVPWIACKGAFIEPPYGKPSADKLIGSKLSRFNLWDHDGRIRVRRYAAERFFLECVIEQHSGLTPEVMVWGAISYH